jgi:hypothetical protein
MRYNENTRKEMTKNNQAARGGQPPRQENKK